MSEQADSDDPLLTGVILAKMSRFCNQVGASASTSRRFVAEANMNTIVFLNPQVSPDCAVQCQLGYLQRAFDVDTENSGTVAI